ncbi:MAG: PIN domain-containing protein [Nitrospirota bacterium]
MLCIDTSSLIVYLEGEQGDDVELIHQALTDQIGVFAPVIVTELLSDPKLSPSVRQTILGIPVLPLMEGYWERTGLLRAKVLRLGAKARLADALIAQSCLDHNVPLVTRDRDFRAFKRVADLKLLAASS